MPTFYQIWQIFILRNVMENFDICKCLLECEKMEMIFLNSVEKNIANFNLMSN